MKTHFLAIILMLWMAAHECHGQDAQEQKLSSPMTISLFVTPPYTVSRGYHWHLSILSNGKAHLIIHSKPSVEREFQVSSEALDTIRRLIDQADFFTLSAEYGQSAPESNETVLTVVYVYQSHSVRIGYLLNGLRDKQTLREPAKVLKIVATLRNLFNDEGALDDRQLYERIDRAVGE